MCKSSLEYAELHGLRLYLSNLEYMKLPEKDRLSLTEHVAKRIKFLEKK